MKAAVYEKFSQPLSIQNVSDPAPTETGVVIKVEATGICLSDWHGWVGNDPDITLPHVPGHELSGVIEALGKKVSRWKSGDRVTLPFVCGCGVCPQCVSGNHQVCDHQFQPGFTHWGSFAQYVFVEYADVNLVRIPDELDFVTAASLGCRFATAFRGIVSQGRVKGGQWVAVHGCGGVGLSAVMIASALGANVLAVDINEQKLDIARSIGATAAINADGVEDVAAMILDVTRGGAHVSVDALGSPVTSFNSISSLRKRGRHIQIGLMEANHRQTLVPMDRIIANELEILGSHGMQAYKYPAMLEMIRTRKLNPQKLIQKTVSLEESLIELQNMDRFQGVGITVIDAF
jgi:alcohol dehydrogenase